MQCAKSDIKKCHSFSHNVVTHNVFYLTVLCLYIMASGFMFSMGMNMGVFVSLCVCCAFLWLFSFCLFLSYSDCFVLLYYIIMP